MKSLQEFEALLLGRELPTFWAAAKPHVRNAVRMTPYAQPDGEIPVGTSKLGGCPDLPGGVEWFRREDSGIPLSFICQVNLAEVHAFDTEGRLPARGMLYFFYDCSMEGMPWGFDPQDAPGSRLYFYNGDPALLARSQAPADLDENGVRFGSARLEFHNTLELPDWESDLLNDADVPEDETDRCWDLLEELDESPLSKLLGHANCIQSGMETECEYVTHGLYCGDPTGYNEGRRQALDKNAAHWRLLMQVDSYDELGMMWGDMGRLYLWITEEDLAAQAFEKAWLILQCG